jgi:uncharacterized protein YkwD
MKGSLKKIVVVLGVVVILSGAFVGLSTVFKYVPRNSFDAAVYAGVLIANTNQEREASLGGGQLATSTLLTEAAQLKANDMASKGYFAHVSPDGKTPWYWLDKVGYAYDYAGENLAVNFVNSPDISNAWMASPEHRANILNPVFKDIGIATAVGIYQGKSAIFVVQLFGDPAN